MSEKNLEDELNPKDELVKKIKEIYEVDIGDFKRKVISYLNRFKKASPASASSVQELEESIICNETRDIEELREQILNQL